MLFMKNSLTISEVVEILRNPPENFVSAAPQKAKAGQVFLFKADSIAQQGKYT